MTNKPSVLITGASTGIGATYADRFAKRGHDLVLVARDNIRMEALAVRLRKETDVKVDILPADLTNVRDLAQVEARLRDDHRIGILVNNAGTAPAGGFVDQNPDEVGRIVSLNAMAPMRLASVVAPAIRPSRPGRYREHRVGGRARSRVRLDCVWSDQGVPPLSKPKPPC